VVRDSVPTRSPSGSGTKDNVDEDDDDHHEHNSSHSHQARTRNVPRPLRFHPGYRGHSDYDDCDAEPYEPVHECATYKRCAICLRVRLTKSASGTAGVRASVFFPPREGTVSHVSTVVTARPLGRESTPGPQSESVN
jgi:hypothetical protein